MNDQKNEKYDFLYQHAKTSFENELGRFKNIEDKASKFIGLLSIMIVGYSTIVRFSGDTVFPPKTEIEWVTLVFIGFTFLALLFSWGLLFQSLKFIEMPRLPLDSNYIEGFKSREFSTNQYLLAETYSDAHARARNANTQKTKPLLCAYRLMTISAFLLSISLVLLTFTAYIK